MKTLSILALLVLSFSASANSELRGLKWTIFKEKNGIRVFKPVNYKHSTGIVPIRFIATIDHNISKVLTVMADNERKHEWLPAIREIKNLVKIDHKNQVTYYRYNSPWPFLDRDFIVRSKGEFFPDQVMVTVELKSIGHQSDPKPKDVVRGIAYDGYSVIKALGEHKTEVEMAFLNDFSGNIPTFVINWVQARWPYDFMKRLRTQLSKSDIVVNPNYTSELVPWKQAAGAKRKLTAD